MAIQTEPGIDEYLRKRLMPVEGAIPHLARTDMYGNSIPAGSVGGDLFEYINFQQRYNIDARIARALRLSKEYLERVSEGQVPRNSVDQFVHWLASNPPPNGLQEDEYRRAKSSEQLMVAENLRELYTSAGVLLVDAQGHGIISAKIASTVHDTFHAFILAELDRYGRTTPKLFEDINLRLAQSVTARNALGRDAHDESREIATMLYGEIRPEGQFRFVNFGGPPPLVFSAEFGCFVPMNTDYLVQFPALGLEIPEDHPDRNKYFSMALRQRQINASNIAEITLMSPGDIIFLYSDGVYDGSDIEARLRIERIVRDHKDRPAREICNAILDYALTQDEYFRQIGEQDLTDDKTAFIIKHG
ncbi:MAG: serine/threonine protein phosphatase [Acidobacteria bacterium 13_2_20CM_2_57_6]|nr:MAG: serine/threonine protein phosphatase [Acidobacteria bacterium 13_2_20CM_2_57_6]